MTLPSQKQATHRAEFRGANIWDHETSLTTEAISFKPSVRPPGPGGKQRRAPATTRTTNHAPGEQERTAKGTKAHEHLLCVDARNLTQVVGAVK